jgi:hypothetical protein
LHLADAEDLFMSRHRHRPAETRYCAPYSATPDRETATGRLLASSPAQALRARWPPRPCRSSNGPVVACCLTLLLEPL